MTYDAHKNFGFTVVGVAPSTPTGGTTFSVLNANAANLPDPASVGAYNLTIAAANQQPLSTNSEIIRITAKGAADSGGAGFTQFTISRLAENNAGGSMTARSIQVGDWISHSLTAKTITDVETNKLDRDGSQAMTGTLTFASLTTTQQNALTPVNGMTHYNSTKALFQKYENSQWVDISKSPATKVIAPSGSGLSADTYTTGTNDHTLINSTILAVYNAGGGTVILSPGQTFTIGGNIIMYPMVTLIAYKANINWASGSTTGTMLVDAYQSGALGSVDHISVWGGKWNPGTITTLVKGMILGGSRLHVKDLEFTSVDGGSGSGFSLQIHNATDFTIENIFFNGTISDGVHISGPCARGYIRNVYGTTGDDLVSLVPNEWTPFTLKGDITDIFIEGVKPNGIAHGNAVRVCSGSSGATVYNTLRIKVRNVTGSMATGYQNVIWIGDDNTTNNNTAFGQIDDVTVENISVTLPDTNNSIIRIKGVASSLEIPSIKINNISLVSNVHSFLHLDAPIITNLIVNNVSGTISTAWTGGVYNALTGTDVKILSLNNVAVKNSGTKSSQLLNNFGSTSTHLRNVHLSNVYLDNFSQLMDTASATNLFLSNIRLVNNAAMINIRTGAAVVIQAVNGILADATTMSGSAGTIESKSPMYPLDINNSTLAVNKGDMAYNTNASASTGVGPVAYNGSAWEPIALPQSLYTTSSPTFAGLTIGSLAGVLKASSGVVSGSAVLNDVGAATGDYSLNSHKITSLLDPTNPQDAATKNYVDAVAQGLAVKPSAIVATTTTLPTYTYVSGVITMTATGIVAVDGRNLALNDIILIKNETSTNQPNNGLYTVTTAGAVGVALVLTRHTSMNSSTEFSGGFIFVESGTVNAAAGFVCTNTGTVIVGTTNISFTQFSGAGEITAGAGLVKSGNTLSFDSTYSPTFTSVTTSGLTSSDIVIISATGAASLAVGRNGTTNPVFQVDASTASAVTGILVKGNIAGSGVTISTQSNQTNENVTFDAKGSGTISFGSVSTGNIIISTLQLTNALAVGYGGTGQTSFTNGQLLIGNTTGNTLAKTTLTAGNSVTVTNGAGSITLDTIQDIRTTASPTFAGLSLGTGSLNTVGNIEIDGTAARDITVGVNAAASAGNNLSILAGNSGAGTDLAAGNFIAKTGLSTGVGTAQFQVWTVKPAASTGSGVNSLVNAFNIGVSSGGSVSLTTGQTGSSNFSITGQNGTGTNGPSGNITLIGGTSRGTGVPGRVVLQGSPLSTSSGTTLNGNIDRMNIGATKVLTNNSAINLVNFTLASNTVISAVVRYAIEVFDGTNLQLETGEIMVQCANKGGVFSGNTVTQIANDGTTLGKPKQILTSGTLGTAAACVWAITGANPAVLSVNANSSLTPSTDYPRITYTLENYTQQSVSIL